MSPAPSQKSAEVGSTALFVRRPILALVINVLIVVAGLAAYTGVEIRELPDVDRPIVTISTNFTSASAETIDRELTAVLESAVSRVSGVKSISSSSSFGRSRVTVEFNSDVDLDVAASDMRDAVSRVANDLPEEADIPQIVKADANADAVMRLALTSDTMSVEDMTVLAEDQIVDALSAVPGVADVQTFGAREKIFRIDIDQPRLASLGLTVVDIQNALSSIAFDTPAGSLTSNTQDLVVRATANVTTPEAFEDLSIGGRAKLRDVATVTLGPDTALSALRANGKTGIGLGIIRQARSNTLDISTGVREAIERLKPTLPKGVDIRITSDDATFVKGAIHEVEIALGLSVTIVLGVIFLFLLDWRATLIPAVALPVALVGTLAGIYLVGFSVNILTLLALVLATGLVVDDAIVVLENIVRRRNEGVGPRAAAVLGTQEVFFAVVATTATLVAVFVPLSFLPGQTGGLFREFGFVLAISVLLSAVVALSLCPMLASRMLTGEADDHAHSGILARIGGSLGRLYERLLRFALDAPALLVLVAVLFSAFAAVLFLSIRQELTPVEDRSQIMLRMTAPQGVSLDYLSGQMRAVEALIRPLRNSGEIRNTFAIAGSQGQINNGMMVIALSPWEDRIRTQQQIVADIARLSAGVPGVRVVSQQSNSLGIRGAGQGLQFAVLGNNYAEIGKAAQDIVADLEKDRRFRQTRLTNDPTQPQLAVTIDRDRAADLGIDIAGLGNALEAMLDGRRIGAVYIEDRSFDVKLVSTTNPINDPTDLENIFLETADGRSVPISTVASLKEQAVPPALTREQQLRSVGVTAGLSDGFALGEAWTEAQGVAAKHLKPGMRIVPLAEAQTLGESSSGLLTTFGFAIVIILLVLAAQFESFVSAAIIMVTVPLGLACAVVAMVLSGTTLNVYSQIGLVLLVGIMAKNGILIVEFANQLRDRGASVREAVERASSIRLRPVMMTMICAIVGGVPLVLASGAGAEARIALGWIIVGGLGLSTLSTLFLTPVAYLLLARLTRPKVEEEARLHRELVAAAAPAE